LAAQLSRIKSIDLKSRATLRLSLTWQIKEKNKNLSTTIKPVATKDKVNLAGAGWLPGSCLEVITDAN
jgi:hypothetical protein